MGKVNESHTGRQFVDVGEVVRKHMDQVKAEKNLGVPRDESKATEELSLAQRLFDAKAAYHSLKDGIEATLDTWWPDVIDRIATDEYDKSLEIYFDDSVLDTEPTDEQVAQFWAWGFSRCWLNFKGGHSRGGTERAYVEPELLTQYAAIQATRALRRLLSSDGSGNLQPEPKSD